MSRRVRWGGVDGGGEGPGDTGFLRELGVEEIWGLGGWEAWDLGFVEA